LTTVQQGECEFICSLLDSSEGNFDSELKHLQKAIGCFERAQDLGQLCWAQLRLLALVADRIGPESASDLISRLRANVSRAGDPTITSALHIFVAELDGKRGLVSSAVQHTMVALRLLTASPNLWLEAWAHNNLLALSIIESDFDRAHKHGQTALAVSEECGADHLRRRCLGNLGNLHLARGDYETALAYLERSLEGAPPKAEYVNAAFESIARIYLAQGKTDECIRLLDRIDYSIRDSVGKGRYVHRHSKLTRIEVYLKQGAWTDALNCADTVLPMAIQAQDDLLCCTTHVLRSAALFGLGRIRGFGEALEAAAKYVPGVPISAYASYEATLASVLALAGEPATAAGHSGRFRRVNGLIGAADKVENVWSRTAEALGKLDDHENEPCRSSANLLQNIAALMLHAGRPELIATDLVAVLADSTAVDGAVAIARAEDGSSETLATVGDISPTAPTRTFAIGSARGRTIEVACQPHTDIESLATLNGVTFLLGIVANLERAQAEREERLTLWPIEELPSDDNDAVMTGQMRDLMAFVRKVARANVSVLLTGESGTGKEVLARAIHGFSGRATKPFVPFNCTAVPRELIESQLFGYRRGAFTGADRDNHGLIRAARDGTLFLDEIGELGLDLQPKLLRFLESGEIHPLGEPTPLAVDVRIVAATNANLDELVQAGRFREDLFYRLNVIRLTIPPLRERRDEIPALVHHFVLRAAEEFEKGRVRVAEETMEHLLLYRWPGNVRELQNEIRRMVALAEADTVLKPSALSPQILRATPRASRQSGGGAEVAVTLTDKLIPTLARIEREMIKVALRTSHGRVEAAARALGISRKGLYLKRQRLGL
jgi:DNA-binding NtrC family response regulator